MSTATSEQNLIQIKVENLSKVFDRKLVVNDISFTTKQGQIVGFLGPNGAGKTTTMRMITGFLKPSNGNVYINDIDILTNPVEAKKQFGYLPEGVPSYLDMKVYAFLKFIASIRGYKGSKLYDCLDRVIHQVNLQEVLNKQVDKLSKGFKRRVGLAQAILHNPPILILDEPTDGLDPNQKHEVRQLIKSMANDKVIILSTHILEEVEAICSRVIVISAGKIIADGTPVELSNQSNRHTVKLTIKHSGDNGNIDIPSLHQQLSQVVLQKNLELVKLHTDSGELEEFFRKITTSNYQGVN
jgi:ABC-2 type transport system ATP-binding protein